jgi:hypothetical protein
MVGSLECTTPAAESFGQKKTDIPIETHDLQKPV